MFAKQMERWMDELRKGLFGRPLSLRLRRGSSYFLFIRKHPAGEVTNKRTSLWTWEAGSRRASESGKPHGLAPPAQAQSLEGPRASLWR